MLLLYDIRHQVSKIRKEKKAGKKEKKAEGMGENG